MMIHHTELEALNRPFLVAEAGSTHQGDPAMALKMAEAATRFGADALTFQEIDESRLYSKTKDFSVPHQPRVGWECLAACKRVARKAGLAFSVCVTDGDSLKKALDLGIDFIKIVSYDITFFPFLEQCGKTGLPIFMSTGASTFDEVERALKALNAPGRTVLYHTDCGYPTKDQEINLLRMLTLRDRFKVPVGYCDHTDHGMSCLVAAALGASVIEKHFTLDRSLGGSDHMVALEPKEITALLGDIKRIAVMRGDGADRIEEGDMFRRNNLRRSLALKRSLKAGNTLSEEDVTMLRPPGGLPWEKLVEVMGKKALIDLEEGALLKKEAFGR